MSAHDKAIKAGADALFNWRDPQGVMSFGIYQALLQARAVISAYEAEKAKQSAPDPDGWIPWAGGECPVKGETRVELKLRGYDAGYSTHPVRARECEWRHSPDIIAYRIVKP